MLDRTPQKIRLIPDDYRIQHVGRFVDGRLFSVVQLSPISEFTQRAINDRPSRLARVLGNWIPRSGASDEHMTRPARRTCISPRDTEGTDICLRVN
jgi:hypothetical protein